jgi:hypothetical protein
VIDPDIYLITLTREIHPCPPRDSNPQPQKASGRRDHPINNASKHVTSELAGIQGNISRARNESPKSPDPSTNHSVKCRVTVTFWTPYSQHNHPTSTVNGYTHISVQCTRNGAEDRRLCRTVARPTTVHFPVIYRDHPHYRNPNVWRRYPPFPVYKCCTFDFEVRTSVAKRRDA